MTFYNPNHKHATEKPIIPHVLASSSVFSQSNQLSLGHSHPSLSLNLRLLKNATQMQSDGLMSILASSW